MRTIAYLLRPDVVREVVEKGRPGVYILGEYERGRFVIRYVGRSDRCLRTRLLTHNHLYECSYFIFRYASSPAEGFQMECKWWHDYVSWPGELLNKRHPGTPPGRNLSCPYCHFAKGMKGVLSLPTAG